MGKNKVTVKIVGYPKRMTENIMGNKLSELSSKKSLFTELSLLVGLREARKIGDKETINHTQLGKLKNSGIPFEIEK